MAQRLASPFEHGEATAYVQRNIVIASEAKQSSWIAASLRSSR
jgi:hypothetical protein